MPCVQPVLNWCISGRCPVAVAAVARQVVKGRLAVNEPNLDSAGGFRYEEGEGLEEDEVEANAALLPRVLSELPGGGVVDGTILTLDDQSQCFNVDLVVQHRVSFTNRWPVIAVTYGEDVTAIDGKAVAKQVALPAGGWVVGAIGSQRHGSTQVCAYLDGMHLE